MVAISREELTRISEECEDNIKTATSSKRTVCKDVDKIRIARYACENRTSRGASTFKSNFPKHQF